MAKKGSADSEAAAGDATDLAAFVEELIQLQVKHGVVVQGYDITFWTREDGRDAAERHNDPSYLVTEEKIRRRWEDLKNP